MPVKKRQQPAAAEADLKKRNKIGKVFGEVEAENLFCLITKRLAPIEEEEFVPPPPLIEEEEGFVHPPPPPLIEEEEGLVQPMPPPPPPPIEEEEEGRQP